jgi:hypothetical protein
MKEQPVTPIMENVYRLDPSLDPFVIEQFLLEVITPDQRPEDMTEEWNAFVRFFVVNSPVFSARSEIIRAYGYFLAGYGERKDDAKESN